MLNYLKIIIISSNIILLTACDVILEPVTLEVEDAQIDTIDEQESFAIKLKALTLKQAEVSNSDTYVREVLVSGSGKLANSYNESNFLKDILPPQNYPPEYLIGIGDELTFIRLRNKSGNGVLKSKILGGSSFAESEYENEEAVINSVGRVGSDGSILLLGLGNIQVLDETLTNIREKVRNILVRNGMSSYFQLEITGFKSKKAYIFGSQSKDSRVISLTTQPLSLRELAARNSFPVSLDKINLVILKRDGKTYQLNLKNLIKENKPEIFIEDKDQIELASYAYKKSKVYALTGARSANIIDIEVSKRQSLADVLFSANGPLTTTVAKRSEIYLLRGMNPINAYHLDAQDVSRILVAAKMELRPNDIIFVAQRPIISFSRLLSEISPLRSLLNDLDNGNILR
jgi:polysaccharide biosynthesis/export protein